jgi:hypothetical protein
MALLALAGALAQGALPAAAQAEQVGEYEVKAAILYNLRRFVEWPSSAYVDPQAPTVLCLLGQDPFGESLKSLEQKQDAGGRPLLVRRLRNDTEIHDCHVLYISLSERKNVAQILSRLKGSSVLTVGEMSQFAAQGGIVQFTLEEKQVRFQINLDAAARMNLKISSRLLVLARIVKDQTPEAGGTRDPATAARVPVASAGPPSSTGPEPVAGETRLALSSRRPGVGKK